MARATKTRESISVAMRFYILRRDRYTCRYCGAKAPDAALHVDHVLAAVKGGANDPHNLVAACVRCNLGKGVEPADVEAVEPSTLLEKELQTELAFVRRRLSWVDWGSDVRTNDPALKAVLTQLCARSDVSGEFTISIQALAHYTEVDERAVARCLHGLEATGIIGGAREEPTVGSTVYGEGYNAHAIGEIRVDCGLYTGKLKPPYALSDYIFPAGFSSAARIYG